MTIRFPDVSHYQAGYNASGQPALFAKATQGTGYVDSSYNNFKTQAKNLGIPFVAYHWLDSVANTTTQAQHAFSIVGPNTPLMIDDEENVINVSRTLAFTAAYRALGGRVVLEYAPKWMWQKSGSPNLAPLANAGLSIVSSSYPTAGYSDNGPGWTPYGGITPTIWQYTDKPIDMNAYKGTVEQLQALISGNGSSLEDDDMTPAQWAEVHEMHELIKWNIHPWMADATQGVGRIEAIVKSIASKVDITPEEITAISNAVTTAVTSALPSLVDALMARLPADTMSKEDVEQAVKDAFAHGLAT